jgi:hypothetical protein
MPSENSFKQHIERLRTALKTFNAIRLLDAPGPVKTAFEELVDLSADMNKFSTFFSNHALFIEVPPLVYDTLEDFFLKNPTYAKPANYHALEGLHTKAKDSAHIAARRGMFPLFNGLSLF